MALSLVSAVIIKRLAWQKRRSGMPLRFASYSGGWPAHPWGKGRLGRRVSRSLTHWAAQPPRWLG